MKLVLLTALGVGGATVIGSVMGFVFKGFSHRFSDIVLSFAAGVMLAAAVIGLVLPSLEYGGNFALITTIAGIFCGALCLNLFDRLIPHLHKLSGIEPENHPDGTEMLEKVLLFVLAIAIHNFPEGLATFISGMQEPTLAIPIAVAITIHNIPEGIAVSIPVFFSTGSKKKAFVYSFLSGLSEPLGAVVGFTLLRTFVNDLTFGVVFSMVAGIMVFISLDELLPSAREYGEAHLSIYGLISGMMVMAVSLLLFM